MTAVYIITALVALLAVGLLLDWRRSGRLRRHFGEGAPEQVPGRMTRRTGAGTTAGHEAAALRDNQGHAGGI